MILVLALISVITPISASAYGSFLPDIGGPYTSQTVLEITLGLRHTDRGGGVAPNDPKYLAFQSNLVQLLNQNYVSWNALLAGGNIYSVILKVTGPISNPNDFRKLNSDIDQLMHSVICDDKIDVWESNWKFEGGFDQGSDWSLECTSF